MVSTLAVRPSPPIQRERLKVKYLCANMDVVILLLVLYTTDLIAFVSNKCGSSDGGTRHRPHGSDDLNSSERRARATTTVARRLLVLGRPRLARPARRPQHSHPRASSSPRLGKVFKHIEDLAFASAFRIFRLHRHGIARWKTYGSRCALPLRSYDKAGRRGGRARPKCASDITRCHSGGSQSVLGRRARRNAQGHGSRTRFPQRPSACQLAPWRGVELIANQEQQRDEKATMSTESTPGAKVPGVADRKFLWTARRGQSARVKSAELRSATSAALLRAYTRLHVPKCARSGTRRTARAASADDRKVRALLQRKFKLDITNQMRAFTSASFR